MKILYENQNIPKELESYIKYDKSLYPYFEINFQGIKPKNYCGFILINGYSYFIIPKISNSNRQNLNIFIYMLIYAYNINIKHNDIINGQNSQYIIFELFIKFFSDTLLDELKRGIFKEYITIEDNLKVLRGKYIIKENFNNFYHQNIYCEFDEFSIDNTLNRFFFYAIKVFKKYSSYNNLYKCESILDDVSYINIDFQKLNIYFDRINNRYKNSYEIAFMILQKLIPMTQNKNEKSFAFLFDMSEVFEKFVGKIYKEIEPSTKIQYSKTFNDLQLRPDIYMDNQIIDIKYKSYDRSGITRDDKYQMFVYGVNFGIRDTMLLYPKHLNSINENLRLGKGENLIDLKLRSLDLEFDGEYGEFICEIRKRLLCTI